MVLAGCSVLEGKVVVKGNEPHTYLVIITDENEEYLIVGKYKQEIWDKYQNQRIKVKGKIVKEAVGPGFPAEFDVFKYNSISGGN